MEPAARRRGWERGIMSETLVQRIKRWNNDKPNEIMQVFSSDVYEIVQRAEASEAERDTAWAELREIRRLIDADKDEATSDEVQRVVHQRDDLRQKLEQAQKLIEELYNAWGDAPLMVAERHDRIDAMTKAATIHYEAQS